MAGTFAVKAARIAIVAALFAVWELLSRTGIVNPRLLPSASDTLVMLWELLQRAGIRNDLMVTASEVLTAWAWTFATVEQDIITNERASA